MASAIIHMCIANEINKKLKRDKKKILIGSIAPDLAKQIGETKIKSHFIDDGIEDIPNMERYLEKYKKNLNDDFVMGYYIHLYTDYLWFKYFIPNFIKKDFIYTLDGKKLFLEDDQKYKYIYNDYTNLNILLLDEYDMDLSIFYEEKPNIEDIIKEIPMNKIQIIIDKLGLIIKNSTQTKPYLFDLKEINKFINFCTNIILSDIEKI